MTAKTRAIPSLHRDYFLAKVSGSCRCSRRVTQPPFIAGPLGSKAAPHQAFRTNDKFFYRDCFANQLNASDPNCKIQNILHSFKTAVQFHVGL
jgi:hypothetical protein